MDHIVKYSTIQVTTGISAVAIDIYTSMMKTARGLHEISPFSVCGKLGRLPLSLF
jgi:hypothetical protein